MTEILEEISHASEVKIEIVLKAVVKRYAVLYPDWELITVSVQKSADRNAQLDTLITMLQNQKDALPK